MTGAFAGAFTGRSVFVTGHTGFKGSWLALWLQQLGAKITGYATQPPTTPSNFDASGIRDVLAEHHEADIRDRARLSAALQKSAPDVVFHLAAQSLVRESYRTPYDTFDVNTLGTAALLEAVRLLGRPCAVVIVTSDKCYENDDRSTARRESDALGGHDPYSASKGAAEIVAASYRRSFFPPDQIVKHGIRVASARAGNVIGGGDWAKDRIVPDLVDALTASRPVPVRNPDAIRPWQHVLEPLSGYLTLASRLLSSDPGDFCTSWNFGPAEGKEAPVRRLVECFIEAWGGGTWADRRDPAAPHESPLLSLSIEKAVSRLKWTPRWSLEEAVGRTARWYRGWTEKRGSMRDACLADIREYQKGAIA